MVAPIFGMGGGYRSGGYGRRNTMSGLGILCVISIIIAIIGAVMLFGSKSTMERCESDNLKYSAMIAKAEANQTNAMTRDAKVTAIWENDKGGKWWYEYEIIGVAGDAVTKLPGYTLPVYTVMELADYEEGVKIVRVAINGTVLNANTDSIPLDFKGKKVTDDGDYIGAQGTKTFGTILLAIFGVIAVLSILGSIGVFSFMKKPVDAPSTDSNTNTTSTTKDVYCAYCGAKLEPGATKCPNCGGIVRQ